jgi:hypothetical protein
LFVAFSGRSPGIAAFCGVEGEQTAEVTGAIRFEVFEAAVALLRFATYQAPTMPIPAIRTTLDAIIGFIIGLSSTELLFQNDTWMRLPIQGEPITLLL